MDHETLSALISAYHDGEATVEERAIVERALEESDEARRELEELRELSASLETSNYDVPEGLRESVLRRLERESLVGPDVGVYGQNEGPIEAVRPAPSIPERRIAGSGQRAWLAAGAALVATAATLLMAVHLFNGPTDADGDGTSLADADTPPGFGNAGDRNDGTPGNPVAVNNRKSRSGETLEELAENAARDRVFDDRRSEGDATPPVDVPLPGPMFRSRLEDGVAEREELGQRGNTPDDDLPAGGAPAPSREMPLRVADAAEFAPPAPAPGAGSPGPGEFSREREVARGKLEFGENLADAHIGDVVDAIESRGEEVVVVRLTVVDRSEGLEALQLLLARNAVPADPSDEAPILRFADADPEKEQSGLEAVFVETSSEQLVGTLRAMRTNAAFRELEIDEPLALASLDAETREKLDHKALDFEDLRGLGGAGDERFRNRTNRAKKDDLAKQAEDAKDPKPADTAAKPLPNDPQPADGAADTFEGQGREDTDPKHTEQKNEGQSANLRPGEPSEEADRADATAKRVIADSERDKTEKGGARRLASRQMNLVVPKDLARRAKAMERTVASRAVPEEPTDTAVAPAAPQSPATEPSADAARGGFGGASRASIPPFPRNQPERAKAVRVLFVLVTDSGS